MRPGRRRVSLGHAERGLMCRTDCVRLWRHFQSAADCADKLDCGECGPVDGVCPDGTPTADTCVLQTECDCDGTVCSPDVCTVKKTYEPCAPPEDCAPPAR